MIHESLVIGIECKAVVQGWVTLGVYAVRIGELEKLQTVVVKREGLRHTRQIVRTERTYHYA